MRFPRTLVLEFQHLASTGTQATVAVPEAGLYLQSPPAPKPKAWPATQKPRREADRRSEQLRARKR